MEYEAEYESFINGKRCSNSALRVHKFDCTDDDLWTQNEMAKEEARRFLTDVLQEYGGLTPDPDNPHPLRGSLGFKFIRLRRVVVERVTVEVEL